MKKKRNKAYRPKPVNVLAFEKAIRLTKPIDDKAKMKLSIDNHVAIEAFAKGVADKAHFDTLASTVDVSLLLLNGLFEDEKTLKAEVKHGWLGMVRARERFKTASKLGLDGQALTAMKRVCEIYDALIENVTGAELLSFYAARESAIRSGNYFKGKPEEAEARIAA